MTTDSMKSTGRVLDLTTQAPPVEVAVFMDLENVVHNLRERGDWDAARVLVASLLHQATAVGRLVYGVASGDKSATRELAFGLSEFGIRTFPHRGGKDAADLELIRRMRSDLSSRIDTVVIISGDHAFAAVADELRERRIRVEVLAPKGNGAALLREAADRYLEFGTRDPIRRRCLTGLSAWLD